MEAMRPNRSLKSYFGIALRGVCMGSADVVPGVSGGTMALITGIYEELILSIRSFDARALRLLMGLRIKDLFGYVRWPFLCALLMGILLAIFSLSRAITYLLENEPVLLWAFFLGWCWRLFIRWASAFRSGIGELFWARLARPWARIFSWAWCRLKCRTGRRIFFVRL